MKHEQSALVKSNYDQLPREAKKTADSTFDRIWKYYHNDKTRIELSAEENTIRERWEKAWLLLCRHRTQKQVVELIGKLFNISQSVAYDDVRKAMTLFSNPQEDIKEGKRRIAESMILQGADRCWKAGDMEGYNKFTKQYIDINKLDLPDDGINDLLKKLKPTQIIIVADKSQLEAKADALQDQLTKDIEHEDVE